MKRWSLPFVTLITGAAVGAFLAGTFLQGQGPVAPPVPRELTSYRDVVKRVLPAVVSIQAKAKPGKRAKPAEDVPEPFRRFQNQEPDDGTLGFGSGFVADPRGVILTNNHVVDGAEWVEVTLADGRKFTSTDVKADPKTDLAIIRVEAKEALPALELGDSDAMEVGDRVLAAGAPFGLTGSVTHGIVSAKGRSLKMNVYEDFIQTDAAINPGNSGGPLVNLEGKVIGVTSAIKSRSGGFQGVGLAISSNLVASIMDQLAREGTVRRGYLGVEVKDLTDPDAAARAGVPPNGGVIVTQVQQGTPGSKAGLQVGDVIVALNGKAVRDSRELHLNVASSPLGKPAQLGVMRDRQLKTLTVTIEEQPADYGTKPTLPRPAPRDVPAPSLPLEAIGLEVADLTPELAEKLGFAPRSAGALVVGVTDNGAAATAGLRRGQLITKVDKQPVRNVAELRQVLAASALDSGVLLQVRTPQGESSYVLLRKN